jgi:protein O-mannosyl-transferase
MPSPKVKTRRPPEQKSLSSRTGPPSKVQSDWHLYAYIPILAVGLIAYGNSFSGEFIFDDIKGIVTNENVRHLWPPWDPIFKWSGGTRPVMGLSLAINYSINGLNTWGYHFVNLVIHLLNACVLFDLVRRVLLRLKPFANVSTILSLTVVLCWVAHPLNTEAVTYITQRNESLVSLFLLLTLYCVERGNSSQRSSIYYGFAVLFCALGMGTKQNMVAAPLLVLLYDRAFLSGSFRNALHSRRWLYLGLAGTWGVLARTFFVFPKITSVGFKLQHVSALSYALNQPQVIVHYLRLVFWPQDLCLDYYWPVFKDSIDIIPYAILIIGLVGATAWALRFAPAMGFLGTCFFLILAPTSSVMPLNDLAAEHRMYLPSVSVIVIVVLGAYALLRNWAFWRKPSNLPYLYSGTAVVIVVATLTWKTIIRNEDYQRAVPMWRKIAQQRPQNPRAPYIAAHHLMLEGRYEEAMDSYKQALRIKPDWAEAHNNLGLVLNELGQKEEALSHFREALRFDPSLAEAHNGLGQVFSQQGKFDLAVEHYSRALEANPEYAEAHNNLGNVLSQQGKIDLALEHYNRAIQLKPEYAEAYNNLGGFYLLQGQVEMALRELSEAVRLKPDYRDAQNNLGLVLLSQGKYEEAISHLTQSIRLEPGIASTHYSLGRALLFEQKSEQAEAEFNEAIRLQAEYPEAHLYRAVALEQGNRISDAINSYRTALRLRPDWPDAMQKLAWILATQSELESTSQAKESLQLAQKALALAKQPTAEYLDTMAASYAATGRYQEATQMARKAAAVALSSGRRDLSDEIQSRLQVYLAGRPYKQANLSIKK